MDDLLVNSLFPSQVPNKKDLLVAVEHGPDELAQHILKALGRNEFTCAHKAMHSGNRKLPTDLSTAVVPVATPAKHAHLLRAALHVIVVQALPSGGASDVHGVVHLAKHDGRWRRGEPKLLRFKFMRNGKVVVVR